MSVRPKLPQAWVVHRASRTSAARRDGLVSCRATAIERPSAARAAASDSVTSNSWVARLSWIGAVLALKLASHCMPDKLMNWREYDASLRQRGSLTICFTDEAIEAWRAPPRTTPGGQPWYSPLAILTALTLRAVFRLALRQTEGLIGSVIGLLGLDLALPDHSTLCRRAEALEVPRSRPRRGGEPMHLLVDSTGLKLCGAGEWLVEKHGAKTRRSWRKLHIQAGDR